MSTSKTKRCISLSLALALTWSPALRAGDLNKEMNDMFNNLNGTGNFTEPGAFHGQSMNTFSGGSLMYRAPVRTYRLKPFVEYPTARGSCAGIDVFAGSFSVISSEKLKQMLQQITSALPGLAFQLAVEAVSPAFASKIQWLKDLENKMTLGSINTCEMATAAVRGAAKAMDYNSEKGCQAVAGLINATDDAAANAAACAGANKTSILAAGEASTDPLVKKELPLTGNLVWKALKEVSDTNLSDEEREIIMSLVGTVVYSKNADGTKDTVPATITRLEQVLFGEGDTSASATTTTKIKLLKCADNYTECLDVRVVDYEMKPFVIKVRESLNDILNAIQNRDDLKNRKDLVRFVNSVGAPVFRMLSVATFTSDMSPAQALVQKYEMMIAADYASAFLDRYLTAGVQLASTNGKLSQPQLDEIRDLQRNGRALASKLASTKLDVNTKVISMSNMADELETLARNLRSTGPLQVMGMLSAPQAPAR